MLLTAIKIKKFKKSKKKMNLILILNQMSVQPAVKVKKTTNEKYIFHIFHILIHIWFILYNELELLNILFTLYRLCIFQYPSAFFSHSPHVGIAPISLFSLTISGDNFRVNFK